MTIRDYLKDILVRKTGKLDLSEYVPFVVTRYLSFLTPDAIEAVNAANEQTLLEDKQLHYQTMIALFPKLLRLPEIRYISPTKKEKKASTSADNIALVASNMETSTAKVKQLYALAAELEN